MVGGGGAEHELGGGATKDGDDTEEQLVGRGKVEEDEEQPKGPGIEDEEDKVGGKVEVELVVAPEKVEVHADDGEAPAVLRADHEVPRYCRSAGVRLTPFMPKLSDGLPVVPTSRGGRQVLLLS